MGQEQESRIASLEAETIKSRFSSGWKLRTGDRKEEKNKRVEYKGKEFKRILNTVPSGEIKSKRSQQHRVQAHRRKSH
jgi:hypothetical protein